MYCLGWQYYGQTDDGVIIFALRPDPLFGTHPLFDQPAVNDFC